MATMHPQLELSVYTLSFKYIPSDHRHPMQSYCIAQNFDSTKLWWIWWLTTNPPKFYPPKIILADVLLQSSQSANVFATNMF